jgi:hypothetical protein
VNHSDLVRALEVAGFPEGRRGELADEIALSVETYQAGSASAKPTEQFKKIRATAETLRDMLESLPELWRLSLGTIINDKGEWSESSDWRPALQSLAQRADIMTRDQEGNPPKRGAPLDGKFHVLLFDFVLLWERERPEESALRRSAWDSGAVENISTYSGPLLDLVASVLTGYGVKFASRANLGRLLERIIKTA